MSDGAKLYGQTSEEKLLQEKQRVREIVNEILDFGISERQKYQLIKLMGDNLESYHHMKLVTWLVDEMEKTDVGDLTGLKEKAMEQLAAEHAALEDEDQDGKTV